MRTLTILLVILAWCAPFQVSAQFLDKLGDRAADAVERTVERRVETETTKSTDRVLDTIVDAPKNKQKKEKKKKKSRKSSNRNIIGGDPVDNGSKATNSQNSEATKEQGNEN